MIKMELEVGNGHLDARRSSVGWRRATRKSTFKADGGPFSRMMSIGSRSLGLTICVEIYQHWLYINPIYNLQQYQTIC